jgi:Zn finger protein HypA/HybF involved in hydrogenase expression
MDRFKTFHISLPTDSDGFVGRACNDPKCQQYFKILVPDHGDTLYCPYCGSQFSRDSLATSDQVGYALDAVKEEARVYVMQELQKTLKAAFRGSKGVTYKSGRIPPKRTITPNYSERQVDTEFECPQCSVRFQVYGIFGYCPGCRNENLRIYDANWDKIKNDLAIATSDRTRQLRHAYSDLVSTFEVFCAGKAEKITKAKGGFQMLFEARKFFRDHAGADILKGIDELELLALRRVFQKRHACIHAGGKITDRYVKMIPEDVSLLGQDVTLSVGELEIAATAMRTALGSLVKSVERPGV